MALQVGTVDGLINIGPKITDVFVKAIAAFAEQGIEYAKSKGIPFGTAFQRFTYPVYSGESGEFKVTNIDKPVYTKSGKEQSPAFITYCRKMGLLIIDEPKSQFKLTILGELLFNNTISLEEYALIILSKQGVFQDGLYKSSLFSVIVGLLNKYPSITVELFQQYVSSLYDDTEIGKTRFDILLGAFATSGLLVKDNNSYYIAGLREAKIFEDIERNIDKISPALLDDDKDYTSYIGESKYGIFDILMPSNVFVYKELFPTLVEHAKLCGTYSNHTSFRQTIYYGTPGSGKSNRVKKIVERIYPDEREREKFVVRTTFHPDSDYASFVGCYKPQMDGDKIKYEFTPQAFTKAYIKAWKNPDNQVYLIIEEINRGNCAQIFGDLFQLLDRKNGESEYPIDADTDLKNHLELELGINNKGIVQGKLKMPANLNILATMNTSDQSLFPMDSAFKRRWTWKCVPIDYNNEVSSKFFISIEGKKYKWHEFLKLVNERIVRTTDSEDKQMGNFFINSNVDERQFIDKVMFYLWNDVCKEEFHTTKNFFRNFTDDKKTESIEFSFNDLFGLDAQNLLIRFMDFIGVKVQNDSSIESEDKE